MKHKNHEWQLSNLELSKKLKELGVKQDGVWDWIEYKEVHSKRWKWALGLPNACCHVRKEISAFTVAELGEMLPKLWGSAWFTAYDKQKTNKNNRWTTHSITWGGGCADYCELDKVSSLLCAHADTEANARAKMLIWLIENGHVKP